MPHCWQALEQAAQRSPSTEVLIRNVVDVALRDMVYLFWLGLQLYLMTLKGFFNLNESVILWLSSC